VSKGGQTEAGKELGWTATTRARRAEKRPLCGVLRASGRDEAIYFKTAANRYAKGGKQREEKSLEIGRGTKSQKFGVHQRVTLQEGERRRFVFYHAIKNWGLTYAKGIDDQVSDRRETTNAHHRLEERGEYREETGMGRRLV